MKGSIADLMQQAQKMQADLQKKQEELANTEVRGEAGAGLVAVIMTGRHDIKRVSIDDAVLRRYLKVVRAYRDTQPEAVATLRRDFRLTVTYYKLEQDFPSWERRHLRTTSRLERFNRRLRRRMRAAGAYHSKTGLSAMMAQEIRAFHDAQRKE